MTALRYSWSYMTIKPVWSWFDSCVCLELCEGDCDLGRRDPVVLDVTASKGDFLELCEGDLDRLAAAVRNCRGMPLSTVRFFAF